MEARRRGGEGCNGTGKGKDEVDGRGRRGGRRIPMENDVAERQKGETIEKRRDRRRRYLKEESSAALGEMPEFSPRLSLSLSLTPSRGEWMLANLDGPPTVPDPISVTLVRLSVHPFVRSFLRPPVSRAWGTPLLGVALALLFPSITFIMSN